MKGNFLVLAVGLIAFLANLPEIQSQDCQFYNEDGSIGSIEMWIKETQEPNIVFNSFTTDPGDMKCKSVLEEQVPPEPSFYREYITFDVTDQYEVKFKLKKSFGDDLDYGKIKSFDVVLCSLNCTLVPVPATLSVIFSIEPENTQPPVFVRDSSKFTLDEDCPLDLDISSLLNDVNSNEPLSVSDMDVGNSLQAEIVFSVDNPYFKTLEARKIFYNDSQSISRIRYEPRIAVAQPLNAADTPVVFNLTATDKGNPSKTATSKITVNLTPHDLRDPKFEQPYYTSSILNAEYQGPLIVQPKTIRGYDGDLAINTPLDFTILSDSSGGLNLELIVNGNNEVEIKLNSPIGQLDQKMAYVVIQATQKNDALRVGTVVVAIELPAILTTTTSTTSTTPLVTTCSPCTTIEPTTVSCPAITEKSCPPCTTNEPTTNPVSCPTTTEQSCTPCPTPTGEQTTTNGTITTSMSTTSGTNCPPCQCTTSTSDTTCPTFDPVTDCPEGSSTSNPVTCLTSCPTFNPATDCPTAGISTSNPVTCLTNCPTFNPATDCPTAGISTNNPSETTPTLIPTTITGSSLTNPSSITTKNSTASITTTTAGTGSSSSSDCPVCSTESTLSSCPDCPTCPTTGLTNNPDPNSSSTQTPSTAVVSTSCPLTCPEQTAANTPTTITNVAVSCPTSTTPSGNPTVQFQKQQYWSEVVENTPVNTEIVTVAATSTSGELPDYQLKESFDTKYFVIDSKTGVVKNTQSLPIKRYNLEAIAKIQSGDQDQVKIVVDAVKGTTCDGTQFSAPLYTFSAVENSKNYIIGRVYLQTNDPDNYNSLEITSSDPSEMKDYFTVDNNGDVKVNNSFSRTISGPSISLTISAVNKKTLRITPISTIVVVEVLYINQKPEFVGYGSSVMVGYPDRTYFDPSVQMPILTAKAIDDDSGENGTLSYHVKDGSVEFFEIDLLTGVLFIKGKDKLEPPGLSVRIMVKDQYSDTSLNVTVAPLSYDYMTMMDAISDSDSLTDEMIANDMSRILGYQVAVLRLEKSIAEIVKKRSGFSYTIIVYAVNQNEFVSRDNFETDVKAADFSSLDWDILTESLSPPPRYEAEEIMNKQSKDVQSFTIATAVLASLICVALISAAGFIVYKKKFQVKEPWSSKASRAASLEVDKKHWDQRSFSKTHDFDDESNGQVDIYNRDLFGERNEAFEGDMVKPVIRFSAEKFVIGTNQNGPTQTATEDEAYCPPTPVPKKSILKDPNVTEKKKQKTDSEKKVEDAGVKFSSTPEVIQVAATSLEPSAADEEVDLDKNTKDDDDDDDFLIEEF